MHTYHARLRVPVSAADLFAWHERPGAFQRLTPPWQPITLETTEGIRSGDHAVMRLGYGPASIRWTAEHRGYDDACKVDTQAACQFRDVQVEGPFASWSHRHRMVPDGPATSFLEDDVEYELPLAPLSAAVAGSFSRREIERLFGYRHRIVAEDVRRHSASGLRPMTIAITGASGLLGSALCAFLTTGGHRVARLVRTRTEAAKARSWEEPAIYWNPNDNEVDIQALNDLAPDAVIHLAGEPVFGLAFTADKKRRIWESRTRGTQLLCRTLAQMTSPPRVLISASASGFYGSTADQAVTEATANGEGFLAGVAKAWEASTEAAEEAGIRTVHTRIGLVLSPAGGMLSMLGPAVQLGLGGWVGAGDAYWPWIALDDVIFAIQHLIANEDVHGAVNLSAPSPVTSKSFVKTLARIHGRPAFLRAPTKLVRALGGEVADEIALSSVRMLPERLAASGYDFAYPELESALRHLYGRMS